jgi:tyrosine-protein phosphatase SIW14
MVIRWLRGKSFGLILATAAFCSVTSFAVRAQLSGAASTIQPEAVPQAVAAPAEKLRIAGVRNAGKVSDVLFRGAQPSAQGLAELKKLGVTTVVDLRGNRGPVQRERAEVESLGMRFIDIPVRGTSPPTNAQVAQFLKLFQDDPNQKVFVHCYYGADRTGVMVAAYRMAQQHWTPDQAASEMNSFGFHYHLYSSMKSYVRKFPANYAGEPVFATLRTAPAPR